jgi:hypothetical protein
MKLPKELREKRDLQGAAKTARQCSVRGCTKSAIRSLTEDKFGRYAELARLKLDENRRRKIYLCKEHYNAVNKERKSQEKLYKKKGFLDNVRATRKGSHLGE